MKLQQDLPVLKKAGFGLAAISYDSAAVLKDFAARKGIAFPLLADHESKVIRQYGVADRRYKKGFQLDLATETIYSTGLGNIPIDGLAYPSVFVIEATGKVQWRFVSEAAEIRYTAASILMGSSAIQADATVSPVRAKGVSVSTTSSDLRAGLGSRMMLGVEITMPPGTHVYAPNVTPSYIGLSWKMSDSKNCWTAAEATYPEPSWKQFAFEAAKLPVYEKTVRVTRELVISPAISPKDPSLYSGFRSVCLDPQQQIHIGGTLRLQACTERDCLPPQTIPLTWTIHFDPPDMQRAPDDLRREFEQ